MGHPTFVAGTVLAQPRKPDLFSDTYARVEARCGEVAPTFQRAVFPEVFVAGPDGRLAIDISSRVDIALHCEWEENKSR
jgi:hypothetical protein